MEALSYGYEAFVEDFSEVVDAFYPERIGDLARFTGVTLTGASANPSPTGALLEMLGLQSSISEGNIDLLYSGVESTNMTKAAEICQKYIAANNQKQSKVEVFNRQLIESYLRLCGENTQTNRGDVDDTFNEVPITSLPDLRISTDPSGGDRLMSRHHIFEQCQPEQPTLLLIGQSGSGKTTVCCRLLHDWLSNNEASSITDYDLVIYISLSHVSLTDSLADSILFSLLPKGTEFSESDVDGIVKSHLDSLLLIFDSLDDVNMTKFDTSEHSPTLTIGKLLTGEQLPSVTKLITSSSPSTAHDRLHGIDLHILGLDGRQQTDYISRYYRNEPILGSNVLHHITRNVVTSDFCRLPLLLCMVCDISKRENSIHIGEVIHMHVLYSFVIQNEFGKHCEDHGADPAYFVQFSRLLGHVALEILLKNQRVDLDEKRILTDEEKDMIGFGLKAGFLKQVEVVSRNDNGSITRLTFIRFKNKIIQQYFAAARLSEIAEECRDSFDEILDVFARATPSASHFLLLFVCGNSALCCKAILQRLHHRDEFRALIKEYLYEYQEIDSGSSHMLAVLRRLSSDICLRGDSSQYEQRATFSLVQRMKNAKINISSVHLNKVTSSLCLELIKIGAPIRSLVISDVPLTLFRDLPSCTSLKKLQISDVDVTDEDILEVFKWVSQQPNLICLIFQGSSFPGQPSTHLFGELNGIGSLNQCRVFKEEDGDSVPIYSELNRETQNWQLLSTFDYCKFQYENGLMHEAELRWRTKQPNLISRTQLEANCIPHTNCDVSHCVPEIVLEDVEAEAETETDKLLDDEEVNNNSSSKQQDENETLLTAQQSLHEGKISVDNFMQSLQRLHGRQTISISQYIEEIRILRNTEKIDADTCFHMVLSAGDTIQDQSQSMSFMEDVRQLARFQKITTSQLFQIFRHLVTKAQLRVDDYLDIIIDMKERKEIKKDQFIAEIDELKHQKLIGQLAYIKLRLTH